MKNSLTEHRLFNSNRVSAGQYYKVHLLNCQDVSLFNFDPIFSLNIWNKNKLSNSQPHGAQNLSEIGFEVDRSACNFGKFVFYMFQAMLTA